MVLEHFLITGIFIFIKAIRELSFFNIFFILVSFGLVGLSFILLRSGLKAALYIVPIIKENKGEIDSIRLSIALNNSAKKTLGTFGLILLPLLPLILFKMIRVIFFADGNVSDLEVYSAILVKIILYPWNAFCVVCWYENLKSSKVLQEASYIMLPRI